MPPVPATISRDAMLAPHPSRIGATNLAAFGAAPQGTQYSIRMRCVGLMTMREVFHTCPLQLRAMSAGNAICD